jgi:hypothetical protein
LLSYLCSSGQAKYHECRKLKGKGGTKKKPIYNPTPPPQKKNTKQNQANKKAKTKNYKQEKTTK